MPVSQRSEQSLIGESTMDRTRCPYTALRKIVDASNHSAPKKYPSIACIPATSHERLAQAAEDGPVDIPKANTYLYLAYGSNLCAETFLGMRKIRPLSQTNVSVPTLELTFDLPGLPYREPCFANVDYRKVPKDPKLPDPPKLPPFPPPGTSSKWDGGLIGVVYEVTEEDYRTIIRTEGGGASYKEILVPCIPIKANIGVPEKPPIPELPKPFLARTLYAPRVPNSDLPDDPRKKKWWYRFLLGPQREPGYAQASARYLKLITDGAREHDLPSDYQDYLQSLQPYTITSFRQKIGQFLLILTSGIFFMLMMVVSKKLADDRGKLPPWLAATMTALFSVTWMVYDGFYKPIFGDGERTESAAKRRHSLSLSRPETVDEEKVSLMKEY